MKEYNITIFYDGDGFYYYTVLANDKDEAKYRAIAQISVETDLDVLSDKFSVLNVEEVAE